MQVEPRFKPDPVACPCGCGIVAQPRRKAWQDGLAPHSRGCPCRRCIGSRQRGKASRRERRIASDMGGDREVFSGALSGVDGRAGLDVWEETAEKAVCRGIRRWWNTLTVQRKIARLMARTGVRRALVLTDEKPWLVVMLYEDYTDLKRDAA